jgi:penicillin-binding protein 1C
MTLRALGDRAARGCSRVWRSRVTRRAAIAAAVVLLAGAAWARLGPLPADLLDTRGSTSTLVVDRHGAPLYEALSGDGTRSVALTADTLPPILVNATVAAEDRRFWWHPGVDPLAMLRSAKTNLAAGRVVEGGSTISQQVAKLLLNRRTPDRRRGVAAKIHEAVLALRLEHRFTKREMLALYLNHAAYGNQVIGAERASRTYFGGPASMLTAAQAAFLAGLPQRPSGFNPYRHRDAAIARQRVVLSRMVQAGTLTAEQARDAREERLAFSRGRSPLRAPHFVDMVLAATPTPRPARVQTTIDGRLQADIAGIIESHRTLLDRHGAHNVAVAVLDNGTGEWLAWEGSGDYFDAAHGGTIDGVTTPRQPGSALKPFTYALAFEKGWGPSSVLADLPSHFPTADPGVVYTPRNYDGRYRGPLLARRALAGSENVPAVVLASEIGVPALLRFLQRAGFTTFDRNAAYYGLGVTLGNAEVRLDQLVSAFAALARGGEWIAPVWEAGGDPLARARRPLVSPRTAFWITDILSDPEAREYVFGRGGSLEFPFSVAVKTGTSQAYHDNWTVGYSRHVTVGVWVGNFDRTPLRNSSGVTGAAPIFQAVMLAAERRASGGTIAHGGGAIVSRPGTTEMREICGLSGLAAHPWCPVRQREWVAREAAPLPCSWHHLGDEGLLTIYPAEYQGWARDTGRTPRPAQARRAGLVRASSPTPAVFGIANPPQGATYLIDPTLRREFQTLSLRTVAAAPGTVEWTIDDKPAGTAAADESIEWPLVPGRHRIAARDAKGRTAETTIVVK